MGEVKPAPRRVGSERRLKPHFHGSQTSPHAINLGIAGEAPIGYPERQTRRSFGECRMRMYETVETLRGNRIERIKSSLFYLIGFCCLAVGLLLIMEEIWFGAFLILTAGPCFFLYPIVRFLFGGKDSVGAVVATVVIEEMIKSSIEDIGKRKRKRRY